MNEKYGHGKCQGDRDRIINAMPLKEPHRKKIQNGISLDIYKIFNKLPLNITIYSPEVNDIKRYQVAEGDLLYARKKTVSIFRIIPVFQLNQDNWRQLKIP